MKTMFPIAELSFTVMKYFGIWRPTNFTSKWTIFIYSIYNIFVLILMYFHTVTFLVSICLNFDNIDQLTDNVVYFAGLIVLCFKMTYFTIYRNDFIKFKEMFLDSKCIPQNNDEISIRIKFHKNDRYNSQIFMTTCLITAVTIVILPLTKGENVTLILRTWIPYEINSAFRFWMTYLYQTIIVILSVGTYSAVEVVAAVMMQQICAQLEICMCRLMKLPQLLREKENNKIDIHRQESEFVENCVMHHVYIFRLKKQLNDLFSLMVFMQFFATTISLCTVVYQLSRLSFLNLKFWTMVVTFITFLMQIFLYCIFGDIMIEKSLAIADAIYNMNWTSLTEKTKRNLIMIMVRSNRPIILNGASLIPMSIDTFVKILKASFSIFNLLQSTT